MISTVASLIFIPTSSIYKPQIPSTLIFFVSLFMDVCFCIYYFVLLETGPNAFLASLRLTYIARHAFEWLILLPLPPQY